MENTSIQASQENTSILLQSPWRTHQSRPHRRTNHPATQESESSCSTRERIILFHKRANHLVPQESESSCSSAHHQGRVSHPVVVCCSSNNRKPPRAPRAQCMQHA